MRYFIPEWDDRVDPDYDFLSDTHSAAHDEDALANDAYMWDLFGVDKVPFDGVLVSVATLQKDKRKYQLIQEKGIHGFLGLPQDFPIMADCGAFGYIEEEVPPYSTSEILRLYRDLGFNYGVSIDHLVVPAFADEKERRMQITLENGLTAFDEWTEKYRDDYQLIAAVQGETIDDYLGMLRKYLDHGITHIAFGSLVRSPTKFILELLDALIAELKVLPTRPEYLHFFGVARYAFLPKFEEIEDLGIEVAFDSASFLRSAWLAAPTIEKNYITEDGRGYTAIRIPQTLKGERKKLLDQAKVTEVGNRCLSILRQYGQRAVTLEAVLPTLAEMIEVTGERPILLEKYQRLLEDRPWETCGCEICAHAGIEVVIFRGNNRNRRRGFHNTFTFHKVFKNPEAWSNFTNTRKISAPTGRMRPLNELPVMIPGEKVLVITSCCKTKRTYDPETSMPARDLYQGAIFRKARQFAEQNRFDYVIISAKYGLINPEDEIAGYEQILKVSADVDAILDQVTGRLQAILPSYDRVIVIAGERYRETLRKVADDRFGYLEAAGIGDMQKKLNIALTTRGQCTLANEYLPTNQ